MHTHELIESNKRIRILNNIKPTKSNVLYLMSRDIRIFDNHCVELAYDLSYKNKKQLFIGIELNKLKMNERQKFLVQDYLKEMAMDCLKYNLHFNIIDDLINFIKENEIKIIIVDFNPMKEYLDRINEILNICLEIKIQLLQCDSHNIVPCYSLTTYKRTPSSVRMLLYKEMDQYLINYKKLKRHKYNKLPQKNTKSEDTKETQCYIYNKGIKLVERFFQFKYKTYNNDRNNPDIDGCSCMSPYLHFGFISPLSVFLRMRNQFGAERCENYISFMNQIIIWREISDHFLFHEKNYYNINGALDWAKETLKAHSLDERDIIYSNEELENAKTDNKLWNCAQNELIKTGKIHGYVRMYWAKQILKWKRTPEEALEIAIYLNDKYALDGNDPNGYMGIMWCICGSMDRGFGERAIFGKIRTMKDIKCPKYIQKWGEANTKF